MDKAKGLHLRGWRLFAPVSRELSSQDLNGEQFECDPQVDIDSWYSDMCHFLAVYFFAWFATSFIRYACAIRITMIEGFESHAQYGAN